MTNGFDAETPALFPRVDAASEGIPIARPVLVPVVPGLRENRDELLLVTSSRAAAWADVGIMALALVALEVLALGLIKVLIDAPDPLEQKAAAFQRQLLIPILTIRAIAVITMIAVVLRRRGQSLRSVGLDPSRLGIDFLLGAAMMGAAYALIGVWQILLWLFWPGLSKQMVQNTRILMDLIPRLHPLGFVALALMIGVYEELLFRGFLMPRLRRATGSWTLAVILSTVLFTALHAGDQTPAVLVPITILSLVFSVITIRRRSIVPAIFGHFLFDLSQFLGLYVLSGDSWR